MEVQLVEKSIGTLLNFALKLKSMLFANLPSPPYLCNSVFISSLANVVQGEATWGEGEGGGGGGCFTRGWDIPKFGEKN